MKEYEIFNFDENITNNFVFMNTVEDSYYFIEEIYNDLYKTRGKKFSVIIDLFLQNGFSFNRFIMIQFEDKDNYKSLIVNSQEISDIVKRRINQYLKSHIELLEDSALDKKTIEFVRR